MLVPVLALHHRRYRLLGNQKFEALHAAIETSALGI